MLKFGYVDRGDCEMRGKSGRPTLCTASNWRTKLIWPGSSRSARPDEPVSVTENNIGKLKKT